MDSLTTLVAILDMMLATRFGFWQAVLNQSELRISCLVSSILPASTGTGTFLGSLTFGFTSALRLMTQDKVSIILLFQKLLWWSVGTILSRHSTLYEVQNTNETMVFQSPGSKTNTFREITYISQLLLLFAG